MRQRINETRNFVEETFGIPIQSTMKNQNGLDEFDLAAEQEGNSFRRFNTLRCNKRFATVRI